MLLGFRKGARLPMVGKAIPPCYPMSTGIKNDPVTLLRRSGRSAPFVGRQAVNTAVLLVIRPG